MRVVELESGAGTVKIIEPERAKNKVRKAVLQEYWDLVGERVSTQISGETPKESVGSYLIALQYAVLKHLIVAWTVTDADGAVLPLPSVDAESLDELDGGDTNQLWEVVRGDIDVLSPNFGPEVVAEVVEEGGDPHDPKAVPEDSSESAA